MAEDMAVVKEATEAREDMVAARDTERSTAHASDVAAVARSLAVIATKSVTTDVDTTTTTITTLGNMSGGPVQMTRIKA